MTEPCDTEPMGVRVHGVELRDADVSAALSPLTLAWPLLVVDAAAPDAAEVIDAAKKQSEAVLALCADEDAELAALGLGADEALRWPASDEALRVRARRAVAHARQPWLERLLEVVDDSVEITTPDVTLLDVNPAFERITGYAREDAIGRTPRALFRTENQDASHYEGIGEALSAGRIWRGELTARRQDGSVAFMAVAIAGAQDAKGRVVGHVAVKRDTTRDDLAWSALRNAEARTQALVERAAEAVFVHDASGSIADVNPAACQMLGVERAELTRRSLFELDDARDPTTLRTIYEAVGAEPATLEARWTVGDDRTLDVELSIAQTEISGATLYVTIARDVTLRREAQRRLQALNEQLEAKVAQRTRELRRALAQRAAVLDHLSDGIISVDARNRLELWNPAMSGLLGGIEPSALGQPLDAISPALGAIVSECLTREEAIRREMALAGGGTAEVAATPIHLDDPRAKRMILGAVVLVRDVTAAKEIDRMKTDFIATVSHELRTPLTSVLGFAKLARGKLTRRVAPAIAPDATKARKALETVENNLDIIAREGARLSDLINDVLDISKMEAGRVDWNRDRIEAEMLVREALEVTSGLFADGDVWCLADIGDDVGAIEGDRPRLLQVLINLISNASKFTPKGSVTVGVHPHEDGVIFSVTDTGVGVPEDERESIFDKFRQARDTLTDKPRGTGLGLPICRHIVEHHGGRIWVEAGPDGGSRFAFTLPARSTRAQMDEDSARAVVSRVGGALSSRLSTPSHVLVVDDDAGVRELLRQTLSEAGHSVRVASHGLEAVTMVRERKPDLVILDVMMPGLTGYDVAAMLRNDPSTENLPIVILSVVYDRDRHESLGIDRYLSKPLREDELLRAIDDVSGESAPDERAWVVMSLEALEAE